MRDMHMHALTICPARLCGFLKVRDDSPHPLFAPAPRKPQSKVGGGGQAIHSHRSDRGEGGVGCPLSPPIVRTTPPGLRTQPRKQPWVVVVGPVAVGAGGGGGRTVPVVDKVKN
jgi:hypothetical protein